VWCVCVSMGAYEGFEGTWTVVYWVTSFAKILNFGIVFIGIERWGWWIGVMMGAWAMVSVKWLFLCGGFWLWGGGILGDWGMLYLIEVSKIRREGMVGDRGSPRQRTLSPSRPSSSNLSSPLIPYAFLKAWDF